MAEMEELLEMENKVFKERSDLERDLSLTKGRKTKMKVLKERLNTCYA